MQSKLIHDDGQRVFAVVLESGDEVMSCLRAFSAREQLSAAQITAIGAFQEAVISYFDWDSREYLRIPVREQVEVASFTGDVAIGPNGEAAIHVHTVLGRRDGSAFAGHLNEGHVRPTLEIILTESPAHLRKRHDPDSGLALIMPEADASAS